MEKVKEILKRPLRTHKFSGRLNSPDKPNLGFRGMLNYLIRRVDCAVPAYPYNYTGRPAGAQLSNPWDKNLSAAEGQAPPRGLPFFSTLPRCFLSRYSPPHPRSSTKWTSTDQKTSISSSSSSLWSMCVTNAWPKIDHSGGNPWLLCWNWCWKV